MMDHSHCTYRLTKGRSAGTKRVLHKAEMHCQHQAKALTPKQMKKAALARPKSSKKYYFTMSEKKKLAALLSLNLLSQFQQNVIK